MTTPISIVERPAILRDAHDIARVQTRAWAETYQGLIPDEVIQMFTEEQRQKMWAQILPGVEGKGQFLRVLEIGDQIFAFSHCGPSREAGSADDQAELYALYILKAYQGLSLGRRLFEMCKADLRSRGHNRMIVWVLDKNPARQFYKAMGGTEGGSKQSDVAGHSLTECSVYFDINKK